MARALRGRGRCARPLGVRLALATVACVGVAAFLVAGVSAAAPAPPRLSARAAELVVAGSGQELYGYGESRRLAIASATKLMSALVTLERAPLHTVFAQNNYRSASVDSQIGLVPGERMTVHDLLTGVADGLLREAVSYHLGAPLPAAPLLLSRDTHGDCDWFTGICPRIA